MPDVSLGRVQIGTFSLQRTQRAEEFADILGQSLWFFESGEVAAFWKDGPALDVERALGHRARRMQNVARKRSERRWNVDSCVCWEWPTLMLPRVVRPERAANRARNPVQHDRHQQVILRESTLDIPAAVAPGAVFLHNPGGQSDWRVCEPIRQRLWPRALDRGVAALFAKPVVDLGSKC